MKKEVKVLRKKGKVTFGSRLMENPIVGAVLTS